MSSQRSPSCEDIQLDLQPWLFSYKDVISRTMLRNDFRLVQECYYAPAPLLGNTIPHSRKSPWHLTHPLQFFLHPATRGGHLCQLSLEKWQAEMQPSATVTWFTSTSGISAFQTKSFLELKLTAPCWWQLHPQWPGPKSPVGCEMQRAESQDYGLWPCPLAMWLCMCGARLYASCEWCVWCNSLFTSCQGGPVGS